MDWYDVWDFLQNTTGGNGWEFKWNSSEDWLWVVSWLWKLGDRYMWFIIFSLLLHMFEIFCNWTGEKKKIFLFESQSNEYVDIMRAERVTLWLSWPPTETLRRTIETSPRYLGLERREAFALLSRKSWARSKSQCGKNHVVYCHEHSMKMHTWAVSFHVSALFSPKAK